MADRNGDATVGLVFDNVPEAQAAILAAVLRERAAQDAKFGVQAHRDVDPELTDRLLEHFRLDGCTTLRMAEEFGLPTAEVARGRRKDARARGTMSWFHVLAEWVAEACEAATLAQQGQGSEDAVDRRLVKVMATAMACLEARARRRAGATLHCFSNGTDYVSARDFDDAAAVLREVYGEDTAAAKGIARLHDAHEFVVCLDVPEPTPDAPCAACNEAGHRSGQSTRNMHFIGCAVGAPRKPAVQWAAEGRGLISSTEV